FMTLVLASASPRRQELLRNAGIEFVALPANIPGIRLSSESPKEFAERMAKEKARAIWSDAVTAHSLQRAQNGEPTIVLGADTVVVVEDEVLGKPRDGDDAVRMLQLLSGRKHFVITGVCLLSDELEDVWSETTAVHFSELSEAEIR